jgi:hypothetical protein
VRVLKRRGERKVKVRTRKYEIKVKVQMKKVKDRRRYGQGRCEEGEYVDYIWKSGRKVKVWMTKVEVQTRKVKVCKIGW